MKRKVSVVFISILVLGIVAATVILFIPFVNVDGNTKQKIGAYIIASVFWLCILGQIILSFICKKILLQMEPKKYCFHKIYNEKWTIITFLSNKEAKIADVSLFVSAIIMIIMILRQINIGWLLTIIIAMFILTFEMHCVLNGKNYQCIKYLQKYTKENEKDA